MRFDPGDGSKIELPVKLRVYDSIFVPLAKWSMLLAGNYRCVTEDGMRTAQEAVHSDIETSRSVYNFVFDLCVKLGAKPNDLVPFEKYAAAAQILVRPASAARALQNGAPNIERADKLVQLIAKQKGLSHPAIDAQVALVDGGSRRTARRPRRRKRATAWAQNFWRHSLPRWLRCPPQRWRSPRPTPSLRPAASSASGSTVQTRPS